MDIRYSTGPNDVKRYTTEELRKEFLIQNLYQADTVQAVYSHVDRMVVWGIMPVNEELPISLNAVKPVFSTLAARGISRQMTNALNLGLKTASISPREPKRYASAAWMPPTRPVFIWSPLRLTGLIKRRSFPLRMPTSARSVNRLLPISA